MSPLPLKTYERFSQFLNRRLETKQHLTEDSVRYAFFLAMMQTTSIEQHELVLELPHPRFPGKEIDTFVAAGERRPEFYVEFKFHRASKSTSPKPQKAGSLFKDISRQASIIANERHCLVVYLTCEEMASYFIRNEIAYSRFWSCPTGSQFLYDEAFIARTTNTFRKASGDLHNAMVSVEYSAPLLQGHHVRVFDVREI